MIQDIIQTRYLTRMADRKRRQRDFDARWLGYCNSLEATRRRVNWRRLKQYATELPLFIMAIGVIFIMAIGMGW